MKKVMHYFGKTCFVLLCALCMSNTAHATTFTAAMSGNFNASTTWGGTVPSSILTTDIIIIPAGVTVTLNNDVSFSNTATLMIGGTLTSGSGGYALLLTGGTLTGSGTITVDSLVLGLSSGYNFTGTINAQKLTSVGVNLASASNVNVSSSLNLYGGTMNNINSTISLSSGGTINVMGGSLSVSGTGTLNLNNAYNVNYSGGSTNAGVELSGSGLTNVTINVPSGDVTLSANTTINGMLTLTAGNLTLNNYNLTFAGNGNFSASGSGSINSSLGSDISITANGSFAGNLRFASGGNTVHNLNLNMSNSSANVSLGSDLIVTGTLNLTSGKIKLGSNNLKLNASGSITGGSSASYVITDGSGALTLNLISGGSATFSVGTTGYFAPAVVVANSGSASGDVSVNLADKVYAEGTTGILLSNSQAVVGATWHISSTATSAIDYNLILNWSANMELNGFNRSNVYISHYTNGNWDMTATNAATAVSGGLYSTSRMHITSLSPFTVADQNANMTSVKTVGIANETIKVYPNPVASELHFSNAVKANKVDIYDVMGKMIKTTTVTNNNVSVQELPSGYYSLRTYGDGNIANATFVKE